MIYVLQERSLKETKLSKEEMLVLSFSLSLPWWSAFRGIFSYSYTGLQTGHKSNINDSRPSSCRPERETQIMELFHNNFLLRLMPIHKYCDGFCRSSARRNFILYQFQSVPGLSFTKELLVNQLPTKTALVSQCEINKCRLGGIHSVRFSHF